MGLTTKVRRRAAADHTLPDSSRRQEVRLQFNRGERRTRRDVVAAPDCCTRVRQRDDGGCEQKASAGDEVLGHVDVTGDEVVRRMIEDTAELTRHALREV